MEFLLGVVATVVVAIFAPVQFAAGVAWVRSFWSKPPTLGE